MPLNPAHICTPLDVGIQENQLAITLNQNNFNSAVMVFTTVKVFIECGNCVSWYWNQWEVGM